MGSFKFNRTAVVTLTALLGGCAGSSTSQIDATLFAPPGAAKAAPAKEIAKAEVEPGLDLEGAIRQAQVERKTGNLPAATKTLSQLVLVAPDDSRVLGEYGKTLVTQGRSDDALAFLERAVELQPSDWSLFSAQGVAFDQKGEYSQAQAAYTHALSLKPGEPTVLSNSALSHVQSGELDEAERLLQEASLTGGEYPRIGSNLALVKSLRAARGTQLGMPQQGVVQAPGVPADLTPLPDSELGPAAKAEPAPAPLADVPAAATPEIDIPAMTVVATPIESAELNAPETRKAPPVPAAKPKPKPKIAAAKPAPKKPDAEVSLLRPALDGAQQASNER